jgi:hypothetical protein
MEIAVRGFITHKKGELYSDCRDNYAYNNSANKFAISDGVSKSFYPGIWSELLVDTFVGQDQFDEQELIRKCQEEWLIRVERVVKGDNVKWFTWGAYKRNEAGLATFVGLQLQKELGKWRSWTLGDSFLFFVPRNFKAFDQDAIIHTSKPAPYKFDNFPDYYASRGNHHHGTLAIKEEELKMGSFYLMTDAMAEWFYTEKENAIAKVAEWHSQEDFVRFIGQARAEEKIKDDDCSILIIDLEDDEEDTITYKSIRVSKLEQLIAHAENT